MSSVQKHKMEQGKNIEKVEWQLNEIRLILRDMAISQRRIAALQEEKLEEKRT